MSSGRVRCADISCPQNPEPKTQNPKPKTQNPKLENRKPQTRKRGDEVSADVTLWRPPSLTSPPGSRSQLKDDLAARVGRLVEKGPFWATGRILVQVERRVAVAVDGEGGGGGSV